MSERIDPEAAPITLASRSQDFMASDAFKCAPLGGMGANNDYSIVLNAPRGPDGKHMVFLWSYPENIPSNRNYGVQPVSVEEKKRHGLEFSSPSVRESPDGLVMKDGNTVALCWTTATRYQEIQRINDEAARRAQGAKTKQYSEGLAKSNAYGTDLGVEHFTVDRFQGSAEVGGDADQDLDIPQVQTRDPSKVSLAGPKMDGTKMWDNKEGGESASPD